MFLASDEGPPPAARGCRSAGSHLRDTGTRSPARPATAGTRGTERVRPPGAASWDATGAGRIGCFARSGEWARERQRGVEPHRRSARVPPPPEWGSEHRASRSLSTRVSKATVRAVVFHCRRRPFSLSLGERSRFRGAPHSRCWLSSASFFSLWSRGLRLPPMLHPPSRCTRPN